jgi:hypothetical protein
VSDTKNILVDRSKILKFPDVPINGTNQEAIVLIAMPARDRVPRQIFWSYVALFKPKHYFMSNEHVPIDEARNQVVKEFLVNMPEATHLLFWDSDVIPPHDALVKLFKANVGVISGLYFQKYPPHRPHVYLLSEDKKHFVPCVTYAKNKVVEVEGTGMGFCLIRKDVLQNEAFLKRGKWFGFERGFGEDFDFALTLKETGIKWYLDTSVVCSHVTDQYFVDDKSYELYQAAEQTKMFSPQ